MKNQQADDDKFIEEAFCLKTAFYLHRVNK